MKKFVVLRPKTYSFSKDNDDERKKDKWHKKVCHKKNLKFKAFKNCLKAYQIINKVNYLENKEINVRSLKENHREFTEDKKSSLRKQLRCKSEKYDAFTEEIDKISLSFNHDTRISSIDAVKKYPHGISKNIIWKKEKIKQRNITNRYKKWQILIV